MIVIILTVVIPIHFDLFLLASVLYHTPFIPIQLLFIPIHPFFSIISCMVNHAKRGASPNVHLRKVSLNKTC